MKAGQGEIAEWCAALQLMPANVCRIPDLMMGLARAGSLPISGPPARRGEFRRWIAAESGGDFLSADLFAAPVITPVGQRLTTTGLLEDGLWLLERLTFAITASEVFPPDVVEQVLASIDALLGVGERVLHASGIGGPTEGDDRPLEAVEVGSRSHRERLLGAVRLLPGEVDAADLGVLRPFVGPFPDVSDPFSPAHPIAEVAGRLVIAMPHSLVHACLVRVWDVAHERGVLHELAETFAKAVRESVDDSLARLGLVFSTPAPDALGPPPRGVTEAFHPMDADKTLHLQLAVDGLASTETGELAQEWDDAPPGEVVDTRVLEVAATHDDDILGLVVVQSFARSFQVMVPPVSTELRLVLSAAELDVLSRYEEPDLLGLWRFARSIAELREAIDVVPVSQLEEYGLYRDGGCSLLRLRLEAEEAGSPAMIQGFARDLRAGITLRRGRHGVAGPWGIGFVPVVRSEDSPEPRVYQEDVPLAAGSTAVLIEGGAAPIWLTGQRRAERPEDWERTTTILNQLTFWYLRVEEALALPLERIAVAGRSIEIMVEVLDPEQELAVDVSVDPDEPRASIGLPFDGPELDRLSVIALTQVICALGDCTPDQVDRTLAIALDQLELHQHSFPTLVTEVALLPVGLPPRLVLPWGEHRVRQRVGAQLGGELGPDLASKAPAAVLARAVSIAFEDLKMRYAAVDGMALLNLLVVNDEVLRHRHAMSARSAGMQAMAWGEAIAKTRVLEGMQREQASAVATRFLIELVVAEPPVGSVQPSFALVEELLSIGATIIGWGTVGDLDRYSLDQVVTGLAGGIELVEGAPGYADAFQLFVDATGSTAVARSRLDAKAGGQLPPEVADADLGDLDLAFEEELGVGLLHALRVLAGLIDLGEEQEFGVFTDDLDTVSQSLVSDTGLEAVVVASAIRAFALGPRHRYLDPPPGFSAWETWPWRFNRGLSILYRPLLLSGGAKPSLTFGVRAIERTIEYLESAVNHGTYRAKSKALKKVMSSLQKERSNEFNDLVADHFHTIPGAIVRRQFHKVAGRRLTDPDGDVGDVDVLVIDADKGRVLVIEVKRYSGRVSPHQVHLEIEMLVGSPGDPGVFDRHLRRTELVRRSCEEIVLYLGGPQGVKWDVQPLLVTDTPLVARGLVDPPFPVLTIEEAIERFGLREELAQEGTSRPGRAPTSLNSPRWSATAGRPE